MFDQDQRGRGILGNLGEGIPGLLVAEHAAPLLGGLRPALRTCFHALLASRPQAHQRTHHGTKLGCLVVAELALAQHRDVALSVLRDGQHVDHPHQIVVTEQLQFLTDLTLKIGVVEPKNQQLHRSDGHIRSFHNSSGAHRLR